MEVGETRKKGPAPSGLVRPMEVVDDIPGEPLAVSDRLRWTGLDAFRYRYQPPNEWFQPALTHHTLLLFMHNPTEFELHCDGVDMVVPPRAGSTMVVPAGTVARWRWGNQSDSLHVFLKPRFVERVAAEALELDSARVAVSPRVDLQLPQLRSAMLAVNEELTTGAPGGPLAAESLANLLAVYLIRDGSVPHRGTSHRTDAALPRVKLASVISYVEEHLGSNVSLSAMASVARLSPYHFARQFRAATGMPPHQYVISRRVERARDLLEKHDTLPLTEIAVRAGFLDQSHLSNHFKRLLGVTPGQFRTSAGIV